MLVLPHIHGFEYEHFELVEGDSFIIFHFGELSDALYHLKEELVLNRRIFSLIVLDFVVQIMEGDLAVFIWVVFE